MDQLPKLETLEMYLRRTGVLDTGDPDQIKAAKKHYRKIYNKHKKAQYNKTRKRMELYVPFEEHAQFHERAKVHEMKVGEFIRHCANAYIQQSFLSPLHISERAEMLAIGIRQCGGNINQIARYLNTYHQARDEDFQAALDQVNHLVEHVRVATLYPQTLRQVFERGIATDPQFLEKVLTLYYEFLRTTRT